MKRLFNILEDMATSLRKLAVCVDMDRGCFRMNDVDRAKVYSEHLGEKLKK